MKKYLLPESGQFFKANLHCHTTVSDGSFTPEKVKEVYKANGYSIVAYTDHDLMLPHNDLRDEHFLPLTGYEVEINEPKENMSNPMGTKTCHLCLVATRDDIREQVCFHRTKYLHRSPEGYEKQACFDESLPDFERTYDPECVNTIIREGRSHGFFVTYNHPTWSRQDYTDYSRYEGMNAMEVINYGCVAMGYTDHNDHVYDDMLRLGKRIYTIATDDNHDRSPMDSVNFDSCGAWTMIKADKLEYNTIGAALEAGHFYASEGPEIHDLWIEDGVDADGKAGLFVHVTTSPVRVADLIAGNRKGKRIGIKGELSTEFVFRVEKDYQYFRIQLTDAQGQQAYTNAYFLDELC